MGFRTIVSDDFTAAMLQLCRDASAVVNYPIRLHTMIYEHGGVEAARRIIGEMTETYEKLWEAGHLALSVEALVLKLKWAPLFTPEELAIARQRLEDSGHTPEE